MVNKKLTDSTFTASTPFLFFQSDGRLISSILLGSYRTFPVNSVRVLLFFVQNRCLKKNDLLQSSVSDKPYLVSKNVRKLRCKKIYTEHFSIKAILLKKTKIAEIYAKKEGFSALCNTPLPFPK